MARALFGKQQSQTNYSSPSIFSAASSKSSADGREEEHVLKEPEWEAALRHHMDTFTLFDSISSSQRVQWAKDNLAEELNKHDAKRAKFEEDREKWAKDKEEVMTRNLLELRKEVVCAWMRIEELEWQKRREQWEQEANALENEFRSELKSIQGIPPPPRRKKFG